MSTRVSGRYPTSRSRRLVRPEDGRRHNVEFVLQSVYDSPGLTRADLARQTGLTRVTISELVAQLLADGLIAEAGPNQQVRPGKPGTRLDPVPEARDILALDLSNQSTLRGAVLDLRGRVLERRQQPLDKAQGPAALARVTALAHDLAAAAKHLVVGLGVGSPGLIAADGRILAATSLGWSDFELAGPLEAALGCPVEVCNDANLAAVAERRFAQGHDNLLRVQIATGVGAALLVGGDPVLGEHSAAGEIGHVVVEPDGVDCLCGKRGCLETWLAVPPLTARLAAAPGRRDQVLAQAGRHLGQVLAPIVSALDLSQVVLGGPADLIAGPLLEASQRLVGDHTRVDFRAPVTLSHSTLGDDAVLLGAAAHVLRRRLGVQ
ncbi:MAG: ROK family transcriptional regulator [Propionibacteriaceae bacterium]|jgi:predicted NBD/HSP70 family sugar kinase|nr:ROK family transcriptional regulator [Propionibacteriaceae bacterium]